MCTGESICSAAKKDSDIENRLVETMGEGEGRTIERVAMKHIHYHI